MKRICILLAVLSAVGGSSLALAAGRPKDGRYSGEIGPGFPMHFTVSADGTLITGLVLGYESTCLPGAGNVAPLFHFSTLKIKGDKFTGASTERSGPGSFDALHISGSFSGRKVTGKVSSSAAIKSLGSCKEAEPFTASAK
jgi:hypothetical protein